MQADRIDVVRMRAWSQAIVLAAAAIVCLAGCETTSRGTVPDRPNLAPPKDNPVTARDFVDEGNFYLHKPGMELRAQASFRKALRLRPDMQTACDAYCGIALAHQRAGNTAKAIQGFENACEVHPGSAKAWTGLSSATFGEATSESKLAVASLRKSIDFANKAVSVDPLHAEAYMWRGRARQLLGDKRPAAADYTMALDIGLGDTWALSVRDQLANSWFDAGEYELAIKQWRILLRRDDVEERTRTTWREMIKVAQFSRKQKSTP